MALNRSFTTLVAVMLTVAGARAAEAQFGVGLPANDFRWQWGEPERSRGFGDFSVSGNEGGFLCELNGKLRFTSQMSSVDTRQLENELRTSIFFIQSAANAMNTLDLRRELDWAVLDCAKPKKSEVDEETRQQRLDRARERALRRQEQRRERQQEPD